MPELHDDCEDKKLGRFEKKRPGEEKPYDGRFATKAYQPSAILKLSAKTKVPTPVFFHFRTHRTFKIDVDIRGVGQSEVAADSGFHPASTEIFGELLMGTTRHGANEGLVFPLEVMSTRNAQILTRQSIS